LLRKNYLKKNKVSANSNKKSFHGSPKLEKYFFRQMGIVANGYRLYM